MCTSATVGRPSAGPVQSGRGHVVDDDNVRRKGSHGGRGDHVVRRGEQAGESLHRDAGVLQPVLEHSRCDGMDSMTAGLELLRQTKERIHVAARVERGEEEGGHRFVRLRSAQHHVFEPDAGRAAEAVRYSCTSSINVPNDVLGCTKATVVPRDPGRGSSSITRPPASLIACSATAQSSTR